MRCHCAIDSPLIRFSPSRFFDADFAATPPACRHFASFHAFDFPLIDASIAFAEPYAATPSLRRSSIIDIFDMPPLLIAASDALIRRIAAPRLAPPLQLYER